MHIATAIRTRMQKRDAIAVRRGCAARVHRECATRLAGASRSSAFASPCVGCSTLQQAGGPPAPTLPQASRDGVVTATNEATVEAAMKKGTEADRQATRNAYIGGRLVLLDTDFLTYLRGLTTNKRTLDSATEGTVLALAVLGSVIDGARAKENLAALVALVTGLKSNVDKNFYDNRAIDAIASTMVAKRKEVLAASSRTSTRRPTTYPLAAARADLNDYYVAGTMDGAFLTIQAEATKRDEKATRTIDGHQVVRNTLENISADTIAIKSALSQVAGSEDDVAGQAPEGVASARRRATRRCLRRWKRPPACCRTIVRKARETEAIKALQKVFQDAGLIGSP